MENSNKVRLNKLTLIGSIFLAITNAVTALDSRLVSFLYEGVIDETILVPSYKDMVNGIPLYTTIVKYKYTSGRLPLTDVSIHLRVRNPGAVIQDFNIQYLDTIPKEYFTKKEKDKDYLRFEIAKIRPGDEFNILIYSRELPNIESKTAMGEGRVAHDTIPNTGTPAFWLAVLVLASFTSIIVICIWTTKRSEKEKERIIAERNTLQDLVLKGGRLSTGGRK